MNLITEYKGKKALVLSAFDKDNLYWEVIKKQNEYGQDEFIITGDVIDKIAEALQVGYEAQGDVAIWKYRFEQADLCYRYAIQDQMNNEEAEPRTNFDKITESVESLAEFLGKIMICDDCPIRLQYNTCKCCASSPCPQIIKDWLQKECDNEV